MTARLMLLSLLLFGPPATGAPQQPSRDLRPGAESREGVRAGSQAARGAASAEALLRSLVRAIRSSDSATLRDISITPAVGDNVLSSLGDWRDEAIGDITWTCSASGRNVSGVSCSATLTISGGDVCRLRLVSTDGAYLLAGIDATSAVPLVRREQAPKAGSARLLVSVSVIALLVVVVGFALRFLQGLRVLDALIRIEEVVGSIGWRLRSLEALPRPEAWARTQPTQAETRQPEQAKPQYAYGDGAKPLPPPGPSSTPSLNDRSAELLAAFPSLQAGDALAHSRMRLTFPSQATGHVSGNAVIQSSTGKIQLFEDDGRWLATPSPTIRYGKTVHLADHLDLFFEVENPELLTPEGCQYELLEPCSLQRAGPRWEMRRKGRVRLRQA